MFLPYRKAVGYVYMLPPLTEGHGSGAGAGGGGGGGAPWWWPPHYSLWPILDVSVPSLLVLSSFLHEQIFDPDDKEYR